ncbi:Protein DOWNY MILDEW RESISTANCE 6 [Linum perenne]
MPGVWFLPGTRIWFLRLAYDVRTLKNLTLMGSDHVKVINHGVREELMEDGMEVFREFFAMGEEEKSEMYSNDLVSKAFVVSTSTGTNVENEKVDPVTNNVYRKLVGECSVEVRKLGLRILEKMSQGLGLKSNDYLNGIGGCMYLQVNHYPPRPNTQPWLLYAR